MQIYKFFINSNTLKLHSIEQHNVDEVQTTGYDSQDYSLLITGKNSALASLRSYGILSSQEDEDNFRDLLNQADGL